MILFWPIDVNPLTVGLPMALMQAKSEMGFPGFALTNNKLKDG
jgi:hypothetical protein